MYLQLGLMGMEFEKLKKNNFPTDRPIPEKQSRVRGNKNIFRVGLVKTASIRQAQINL